MIYQQRADNDLKLKRKIKGFKYEKEIHDESDQSLMGKAMKLIENSWIPSASSLW